MASGGFSYQVASGGFRNQVAAGTVLQRVCHTREAAILLVVTIAFHAELGLEYCTTGCGRAGVVQRGSIALCKLVVGGTTRL